MELKYLLDVSKISDKSVEEYNGKKKYSATGDIDYNKIINFEEVDYETKPSRANRMVLEGEIIFAKMKGTTKVLKITDEIANEYIFSTGFTTLKNKEDLDRDYLYYVLISEYFQTEKDKYCSGATQKAINNTNLKKIKIPVPPMETQEKIVQVLDQTQDLIDKRKEQIEALDQLIESIFYTMFGDPVRNEKGWKVRELSNLCEMKSGGTPSRKKQEYFRGNIPWITTVALDKIYLNEEDAIEYITEEAVKRSATKIIPKGSLMVGTRVGVGKVSICNVDMCTNQDIVSLIGLEKYLNRVYIYKQLKTYGPYLQSKMRGATIKGINMRVLKDLRISVPPISLQNEFAQKVETIEKQKELLNQSLELLKENYKSIMDKAFKGQLFN